MGGGGGEGLGFGEKGEGQGLAGSKKGQREIFSAQQSK